MTAAGSRALACTALVVYAILAVELLALLAR
jgi:hypothetical protein